MHSLAANDDQRNTGATGEQHIDWLQLAHNCAADSQRRAALRAGRIDIDHAAIHRHMARVNAQDQADRLESGTDPLPRFETVHRTLQQAPAGPQKADQFSLGLALYTNLTAAIFRMENKPIAAAFLYWILQHRGRDRFSVADLGDTMTALGIEWTDRRIRDAVRQGLDVLWSKAHRDKNDRRQWVYTMHSKQRVMVALGIGDPGARVLIEDAAWRAEDVRNWRAFVWSAFVANHPGNGTMSREQLAEQFGVSRRASREFETKHPTRTVVKHQISAAVQPRQNYDASMEIDRHVTAFSWYKVERWYHFQRKRSYGQLWRCWQDVNKYSSNSTRKSASHRRRYLIAGVKALTAENVRINPVDGHASDQGSSDTPQLARRFEDAQNERAYRKKHADRPTKTFMQSDRKMNLLTRGAFSDHVWQFVPSTTVLGGIQA